MTVLTSLLSFGQLLAARVAPAPQSESEIHLIWDWIENHALLAYSAIALLVIGLIAGAMVSTARAQETSAEQRGHLKMEIMGIMRRRVSGVSADTIAADLRIDLMLAARLLAELVEEGQVAQTMTTNDDAG